MSHLASGFSCGTELNGWGGAPPLCKSKVARGAKSSTLLKVSTGLVLLGMNGVISTRD